MRLRKGLLVNPWHDLDFKADQLTPSLVLSHRTTESLSLYKKWAPEEFITDLQGLSLSFPFPQHWQKSSGAAL